jgi:hypothetical protein
MDLLKFKLPKEDEIPTIPLYMDQVTGYLEDIFKDQKRHNDEKILTKTMINNYVKAGLIQSPEKKKYNQSQIKELMMIYMLKGVLQIQEIEKILKIEEDSSNLYELIEKTDANLRMNFDIPEGNDVEKIIQLLLSSHLQKKYAELLIDQFLTED